LYQLSGISATSRLSILYGSNGCLNKVLAQRSGELKKMSAVHPVFTIEAPELNPNIYPPFYDWILQQKPFILWQTGNQRWQLRVVGSPGSGKVEFSSTEERSPKDFMWC
jgi:hypothetical protein